MNWRILQLTVCIAVWSILIGVGLFKLNSASAVAPYSGNRSPVVYQVPYTMPYPPAPVPYEDSPIRNNTYKLPMSSQNPRQDYQKFITQQVTNMNWRNPASFSEDSGVSKQKKINQLMILLNDLADGGDVAIQQAIKLIESELSIINSMLHNQNARTIQQAVARRDNLLEMSLPTATEVYDMTLSLATGGGKKTTERTPFLRDMMNKLEQYHQLIKDVQNTFKSAER